MFVLTPLYPTKGIINLSAFIIQIVSFFKLNKAKRLQEWSAWSQGPGSMNPAVAQHLFLGI